MGTFLDSWQTGTGLLGVAVAEARAVAVFGQTGTFWVGDTPAHG